MLPLQSGDREMIEQQANLLIEFHGKQAAYDIARFKALNDRKQANRQFWKEVMEFIKTIA